MSALLYYKSILLNTHIVFVDNYSQRCCSYATIRNISIRYIFTKPGQKYKIFHNLLLANITENEQFKLIISNMTAFRCNNVYYELIIYLIMK